MRTTTTLIIFELFLNQFLIFTKKPGGRVIFFLELFQKCQRNWFGAVFLQCYGTLYRHIRAWKGLPHHPLRAILHRSEGIKLSILPDWLRFGWSSAICIYFHAKLFLMDAQISLPQHLLLQFDPHHFWNLMEIIHYNVLPPSCLPYLLLPWLFLFTLLKAGRFRSILFKNSNTRRSFCWRFSNVDVAEMLLYSLQMLVFLKVKFIENSPVLLVSPKVLALLRLRALGAEVLHSFDFLHVEAGDLRRFVSFVVSEGIALIWRHI